MFLPGESQGRGSLVGCSPWSHEESDTTERLHFHFSLSCIGEGNGNPLQCSCLENSRDSGAWWAAVYGVAQSRIQLKWLSCSRDCLTCGEKRIHVVFLWRRPELDLQCSRFKYFWNTKQSSKSIYSLSKIIFSNLLKNSFLPYIFQEKWLIAYERSGGII